MSQIIGTWCPNCGNMPLHYFENPCTVDGWLELTADCLTCGYTAIRGFRRILNNPDEEGRLTIMFANSLIVDDFGNFKGFGA